MEKTNNRRWVPRRELMCRLKDCREEVTVLHAGAGYGKTETVKQWAERNRDRCVCYSLKESDNDPARFASGLAAVFAEAEGDIGRQGTDRLPKDRQSLRNEFHMFIKKTFSALPKGIFYICMDDLKNISNRIVFDLIRDMIDSGRGQVRFILCVEGKMPDFLASYFLEERAAVIGTDGLRFSPAETEELFGRMTGKTPSGSTVRKAQEYMEGWPAGIAFASFGIKQENEGELLSHYIFSEVYQKLPWEIREFLLDTGLLDEMDASVCNFALGRGDSGEMLRRLKAEKLFLSDHKGLHGGFLYIPVFRDFLREQAKTERYDAVRMKAAKYYAVQGKWELAADYAISCGEKGAALAGAAFMRRIKDMPEAGEDKTLEKWTRFLLSHREKLSAAVLFSVYRFYRCKNLSRAGMEILYEAAERAYRKEDFEIYAEYMVELAQYTAAEQSIMSAEALAMEAGKRLTGHLTGHCSEIVRCSMEYRLQMEDYTKLKSFLKVSEDMDQTRRFHVGEIRRMVDWALRLRPLSEGRADAAGLLPEKLSEIIGEARDTLRLSKIYAEYGFYCVVYYLYRSGLSGWKKLAEEGVGLGGDGVFARWMKILLLFGEYRTRMDKREGIRKKILDMEAYRIQMGLDFPKWNNGDEKLLHEIFRGEMHVEEDRLLYVKCLGTFCVEGESGEIVWRTKKAKELFACLFYEAGRGVKKDILIERLWPETDAKKASTLFHTTVSYLRKGLAGQNAAAVLTVRNQNYALDMTCIRSDFESLMEWQRCEEEDPAGKDVLKAAELYRQCYMYGEDYIWLGEYPEYVEKIYLETIQKLAEKQIGIGKYQTAVILLKKAVETDCFTEALAERLIECMVLAGDIGGARKQFEKMRKIYREELGLDFGENIRKFLK